MAQFSGPFSQYVDRRELTLDKSNAFMIDQLADGTMVVLGYAGAQVRKGNDLGDLLNYIHQQFPASVTSSGLPDFGASGGSILLRNAPFTYKYSTTPLITKSYVHIVGESMNGVVIEPSADVDGITFQPPTTASTNMRETTLWGPRVENIGFWDSFGVSAGRGYLKFDCNTNALALTNGLFRNLSFKGVSNAVKIAGKGGIGILHNGTAAPAYLRMSKFENIWNFQRMGPVAGTADAWLPDSLFKGGYVIDCIFRDFFVFPEQVNSANPLFWLTNPTNVGGGNEFYNTKFFTASSNFVNNIAMMKLDNVGNCYLEDFFMENASAPGQAKTVIGLELANTATGEFRARRLRLHKCDVGIQWDATCTNQSDANFDDCVIWGIDATGCATGLSSIAGDASLKTFYGGHMSNTVDLLPNPLTGARFYKTKIAGVFQRGFSVTTPGIPASGTPVTNTTGADVIVYIIAGTITVIAVDGTATGCLSNASGTDVIVPAGSTITLTYSVAPTSWKWQGIG